MIEAGVDPADLPEQRDCRRARAAGGVADLEDRAK